MVVIRGRMGMALSLTAALCVVCTFVVTAHATGFPAVSIQGRLKNSTGEPLSGTPDIVVSLYSDLTGGSLLYQEQHDNVVLTGGFYSLSFGSGTVLAGTSLGDALRSDPTTFFTLNVDAGGEMAPRTALLAGAYALSAETATDSQMVEGSRYVKDVDGGGGSPAGYGGPIPGDLWYDDSVNILKYFNGSSWVIPGGAGGGDFYADGHVAMMGPLDLGFQDLINGATINATYFSGDGSLLTGVIAATANDSTMLGGQPASYYTDLTNATGLLDANLLTGILPALDGSALTGVIAFDAANLGSFPPAYYTDFANMTGAMAAPLDLGGQPIINGSWNGAPISVVDGGTGIGGGYAAGDMLYADSPTSFTPIPIGIPGDVLTVDTFGIPAWLTMPWDLTSLPDVVFRSDTGKVGIGSSGFALPQYPLHVSADSSNASLVAGYFWNESGAPETVGVVGEVTNSFGTASIGGKFLADVASENFGVVGLAGAMPSPTVTGVIGIGVYGETDLPDSYGGFFVATAPSVYVTGVHGEATSPGQTNAGGEFFAANGTTENFGVIGYVGGSNILYPLNVHAGVYGATEIDSLSPTDLSFGGYFSNDGISSYPQTGVYGESVGLGGTANIGAQFYASGAANVGGNKNIGVSALVDGVVDYTETHIAGEFIAEIGASGGTTFGVSGVAILTPVPYPFVDAGVFGFTDIPNGYAGYFENTAAAGGGDILTAVSAEASGVGGDMNFAGWLRASGGTLLNVGVSGFADDLDGQAIVHQGGQFNAQGAFTDNIGVSGSAIFAAGGGTNYGVLGHADLGVANYGVVGMHGSVGVPSVIGDFGVYGETDLDTGVGVYASNSTPGPMDPTGAALWADVTDATPANIIARFSKNAGANDVLTIKAGGEVTLNGFVGGGVFATDPNGANSSAPTVRVLNIDTGGPGIDLPDGVDGQEIYIINTSGAGLTINGTNMTFIGGGGSSSLPDGEGVRFVFLVATGFWHEIR
ncbi:MAG: hypothetical protein L6Q71_02290 [Planctomycetes bacterium]|nr:hypothetical protein [Planctomycetota bacterium]